MTAPVRTKNKNPPAPAYPKVIETYRVPSVETEIQHHPSCFNGIVRLRRYRVTVEVIDEPIEVQRDRLLALWRQTERNQHHVDPMRRAAAELGMGPHELKLAEQGIDHKPRRT